ncbi:unnamed protein product [Nezara viridula]|uniref:Uncharacterized protein n=1 Tax=Nezara viridula TaxID=85310 RepID=A0A9P0H747_NEZVI|nr:unnamed protein product [Nezara viridula]
MDRLNEGRKGLTRSRSNSKKPVTRLLRSNLKIYTADVSLSLGQFNSKSKRKHGRNLYAATPQKREPYQPLCEPITPEPLDDPQPPNKNQYVDFHIQLNDKLKEILDALVITGEEFRQRGTYFQRT